MNTVVLVAIIVAVFALVIINKLTQKETALVSARQAQPLLADPDRLILDVRTALEYDGGHIKNARNIPLAELGSRVAEIASWKDKPVLVYCLSGGRSASAARMLTGNGFSKVTSLAGGISAWVAEKYPVEK